MKRLKKMLSLILALVMALGVGAGALAESEGYYFTISDPYLTDGTAVYDFTGFSATARISTADDVEQLMLSLITSVGALNGYAQVDEQGATLYADGFSSVYKIKPEDLVKLIVNATNLVEGEPNAFGEGAAIGQDISEYIDADMFDIDIAETVNAIYVYMAEYVTMFEAAEAVTIDTITQKSVPALRAPFVLDAATLDAVLSEAVASLDESGFYELLMQEFVAQYITTLGSTLPMEGFSEEDILAQIGMPESVADAYAQFVAPLKLNVSGDIYLSEAGAFADITINSDTISILPIAFEAVTGDAPALAFIVDMSEAGENVQFVMELLGGESTYAELAVIADGVQVMSVIYSRAFNAEYGADLYDIEAGVMTDGGIASLKAQYITDDATYRLLYVGVSVGDTKYMLNYEGEISIADGYNETAMISLSSSVGYSGKVNIAFGEAEALPLEIPATENLPIIDFANMTEEQEKGFQTDIETLTGIFTMYMLYGVPGFAALIQ